MLWGLWGTSQPMHHMLGSWRSSTKDRHLLLQSPRTFNLRTKLPACRGGKMATDGEAYWLLNQARGIPGREISLGLVDWQVALVFRDFPTAGQGKLSLASRRLWQSAELTEGCGALADWLPPSCGFPRIACSAPVTCSKLKLRPDPWQGLLEICHGSGLAPWPSYLYNLQWSYMKQCSVLCEILFMVVWASCSVN